MKSLLAIGLLHSFHLGAPELDCLHPVVEYGNFMYYKNTFEKDSFAAFFKIPLGEVDIRIGATTGYDRQNKYKGKTYKMSTAVADNFALFLLPSYNVEISKNANITFALLGNVAAAGITIDFK